MIGDNIIQNFSVPFIDHDKSVSLNTQKKKNLKIINGNIVCIITLFPNEKLRHLALRHGLGEKKVLLLYMKF